jgi:hypothetical protein
MLAATCILVATFLPNCGAISSSDAASRNLLQVASQNSKLNMIEGTEPVSDACKLYPYTRYFRVDKMDDFRRFGQNAIAGDMIELVAGTYMLGDGQLNQEDPGQGFEEDDDNEPPAMATSGTIAGRVGTAEKPIVFCGSQNATIIDGADSVKYVFVGIRVLKSQHVVLTGFTIQNCMKGERKTI